MFPTLTLAQGRLMAPDRAWVTPRCRTPAPAPSRPARPSGDAGPCAADGRDNSQDARPGAAPAVRAPFATGQRRTRPAAAPSPERAGQAGPASASAWVARWASPPPPSRPFAARPETSRSTGIDRSGPLGILIGDGDKRLLRRSHLAQQPNRIQAGAQGFHTVAHRLRRARVRQKPLARRGGGW